MKRSLNGLALIVATLGCLAGGLGLHGCSSDYSSLGSGSDFLDTGRTASFFQAVQVDPRSEDSSGPQFVRTEDLNDDGLLDLVTAWNQNQPVQIHIQRRSASGRSFETVTLAGNVPVVRVSGLSVADFDGDDRPDVAVLVKQSGLDGPQCLEGGDVPDGAYAGIILVYLAPTDPDQVTQPLAWRETGIGSSLLAGAPDSRHAGPPEEEGYTSMAAGDMDQDGDVDLVVAWIPACDPFLPEVLLFINQGAGAVRDGTWTAARIPDAFPKIPLLIDEPGEVPPVRIKSVALGDFDQDGDLDIVAAYPDAGSLNVRWYRNPVRDTSDDAHFSDGQWQVGAVGQVSPKSGFEDLGGADHVQVADIDVDGREDVMVRSTGGGVIQWLRCPESPTSLTLPTVGGTIRHIPWQVYTLAEFTNRPPHAMALGDVNLDGRIDLIASAGGAMMWFGINVGDSVYDQWRERLIVDDDPSDVSSSSAPITDPAAGAGESAAGTFINAVLVADMDGDGDRDVVGTLDRSGLSGLASDALVWFRNTLR